MPVYNHYLYVMKDTQLPLASVASLTSFIEYSLISYCELFHNLSLISSSAQSPVACRRLGLEDGFSSSMSDVKCAKCECNAQNTKKNLGQKRKNVKIAYSR